MTRRLAFVLAGSAVLWLAAGTLFPVALPMWPALVLALLALAALGFRKPGGEA